MMEAEGGNEREMLAWETVREWVMAHGRQQERGMNPWWESQADWGGGQRQRACAQPLSACE